jgi:FixJ family two-component response regulator
LPTASKPTVIAVDDDHSIRRALRNQLRLAGFNVLVFDSGQRLLRRKLPRTNACLLLDVYMPEMTGVELYQRLTAAGRQMPAIMMSARDDDETRGLMRHAKAAAVLFKPFDEKTLLAAIRKVLRKQADGPHGRNAPKSVAPF